MGRGPHLSYLVSAGGLRSLDLDHFGVGLPQAQLVAADGDFHGVAQGRHLADVGVENTIKKIGGTPEVKKHLENLGFVVGGNVSVITAMGGNVIVNVKEARVAISEEMARKIMV